MTVSKILTRNVLWTPVAEEMAKWGIYVPHKIQLHALTKRKARNEGYKNKWCGRPSP